MKTGTELQQNQGKKKPQGFGLLCQQTLEMNKASRQWLKKMSCLMRRKISTRENVCFIVFLVIFVLLF